MWRSLKVITLAIQFAAPPSMPKATAEQYAKVIQEEAQARDFDPLMLVAMVHNESRWHRSAYNSVNCVGLGQVCLSNYEYCRNDISNEKCQAKKQQLYDGVYNLRVIAASVSDNSAFCRKKTGRSEWRHWLFSHGGYNKPSQNLWCGQKKTGRDWREVPPPKTIVKIGRYHQQLVSKFAVRKKKK